MRSIFILVLFSFAFAQPPISETMQNNTFVAEGLDGLYNESLSNSTFLIVVFENSTEKEIPISASIEISGMNLVLDNRTYPEDGLSLILARGYEQGHLIAKPADGYPDFECDRDWYDGGAGFAWRCDFDNDNCVEYENRSSVSYDMNVAFAFRDVIENVSTSSNVIPVPQPILDIMENSSGYEYLNISMNASIIFSYEFNDRGFGLFDCADNTINETAVIPFSLNASFLVAGKQKLFFLRSPVLYEQWFRNNRFNLIVFSQAPLYQTNTSLNNELLDDRTLRTFNVTTDRYGLQQIVSNKTNETDWSESTNLTNPVFLGIDNHSFYYVYEFNHSYDGIGKNNLSLFLKDSFLGEAYYEATILSRMLSYNGTTTETGEAMDPEITRKSTGFREETLSAFEISLGFLGLIIILAFLNFWIKR